MVGEIFVRSILRYDLGKIAISYGMQKQSHESFMYENTLQSRLQEVAKIDSYENLKF